MERLVFHSLIFITGFRIYMMIKNWSVQISSNNILNLWVRILDPLTTTIHTFHINCLRTISNRILGDRIRNSDVLTKCNMTCIEIVRMKIQHRWAEYISCMSDSRHPKQMRFCPASNKRVSWTATIAFQRQTLKQYRIPFSSWKIKSRVCPASHL